MVCIFNASFSSQPPLPSPLPHLLKQNEQHCVCVCVCVCVHMCMHLCACMCVCVRACVCMCACVLDPNCTGLVHTDIKGDQTKIASWPEKTQNVQIISPAYCTCLIYQYLSKQNNFLLWFWVPWDVTILVHSLPMKSKKKTGLWCSWYFATQADLVHDITDTGHKNSSTHGRVFGTFIHQFLTIRIRNGVENCCGVYFVFHCCWQGPQCFISLVPI